MEFAPFPEQSARFFFPFADGRPGKNDSFFFQAPSLFVSGERRFFFFLDPLRALFQAQGHSSSEQPFFLGSKARPFFCRERGSNEMRCLFLFLSFRFSYSVFFPFFWVDPRGGSSLCPSRTLFSSRSSPTSSGACPYVGVWLPPCRAPPASRILFSPHLPFLFPFCQTRGFSCSPERFLERVFL